MDNALFSLSSKTALVTGGSRGIGLAVAKGLARHGADIAIIARNESRLQAAKGQIQEYSGKKVWTFSFDLENTKEIEQLFAVFERDMADAQAEALSTDRRFATAKSVMPCWETTRLQHSCMRLHDVVIPYLFPSRAHPFLVHQLWRAGRSCHPDTKEKYQCRWVNPRRVPTTDFPFLPPLPNDIANRQAL